jgi:hypothetical protein
MHVFIKHSDRDALLAQIFRKNAIVESDNLKLHEIRSTVRAYEGKGLHLSPCPQITGDNMEDVHEADLSNAITVRKNDGSRHR